MSKQTKIGPTFLGKLEGRLARIGRSGAHIIVMIEGVEASIPFAYNSAKFTNKDEIQEGLPVTADITRNNGNLSAKNICAAT